jgi:hypothetical protein
VDSTEVKSGTKWTRGGLATDGPEGVESTAESTPKPYSDQEWQERLQAAVEKTMRARQLRRSTQLEFKRRRNAGLRQRHAQKLARTPGGSMTSTIQITKTSAREMCKDIRAQLRTIEEALAADQYEVVRNTAQAMYSDMGSLSFGVYPAETR